MIAQHRQPAAGERRGEFRRVRRDAVVARPVGLANAIDREDVIPPVLHDADRGPGHAEENGDALHEPRRQRLGVARGEQDVALEIEELFETNGVERGPCRAGWRVGYAIFLLPHEWWGM